jgi:hypothetical protein
MVIKHPCNALFADYCDVSDDDGELGVGETSAPGDDDDSRGSCGGGGLLHATAAAAAPQFLRSALVLYAGRPDAALSIRTLAVGALRELQGCFDSLTVSAHLVPQVPVSLGGHAS